MDLTYMLKTENKLGVIIYSHKTIFEQAVKYTDAIWCCYT